MLRDVFLRPSIQERLRAIGEHLAHLNNAGRHDTMRWWASRFIDIVRIKRARKREKERERMKS